MTDVPLLFLALHTTQVTGIMGKSLTSETICLTNAQNTATVRGAGKHYWQPATMTYEQRCIWNKDT